MGGLSLFSPWFLAGALAVVVPFVLHLFARETARSVDFSAVRFIRRAPAAETSRRRLSDPFLLLLRMLALVLLALVFARPFVAGGEDDSAVTLVVVDRSLAASGPTEWQATIATATHAIDNAPSDHAVGIVGFDDRAETIVEPARDRAMARAAIEGLSPTAGGAHLGAALGRAADVLAGRAGDVVVVSPLVGVRPEDGVLAQVPTTMRVEARPIAPAASNLAVRAVARDDAGTRVVVVNHGAITRDTTLTLRVDDVEVASVAIDIPPGQSRDVRLDARLPQTGVATASVTDGIGPTFDDTHFLVLDADPPRRALVVTAADAPASASFYVERALAVWQGSPALEVAVIPATDRRVSLEDTFDGLGLVVLTGTRGLDRRGREQIAEFVRDGGGLLMLAGPDTETGVVRDLFGREWRLDVAPVDERHWPAAMVATDVRHPVFAAMGPFADHLADVRIDTGVAVTGAEWRTIARFTSGTPAMVEATPGRGRVIVFASDLGQRWNGWPLHTTFLPWLHEVVAYLARDPSLPRARAIGQLPTGAPRVPGVVELGDPPRRVAVNVAPTTPTVDGIAADEVLARVLTRPDVEDGSTAAVGRLSEGGRPLWRQALLLLVLLLCGEAWLASRPRHVSPMPVSENNG